MRRADPRVIHHLYAPLEFEGRLWRARLTVKETVSGRRLSDHRLMELRETGAVTIEGGATTADGAARLGPSPASAINVGRLVVAVNFDDAVPVLPDGLSDLALSCEVSAAASPDAGTGSILRLRGSPQVDLAAEERESAGPIRVDVARLGRHRSIRGPYRTPAPGRPAVHDEVMASPSRPGLPATAFGARVRRYIRLGRYSHLGSTAGIRKGLYSERGRDRRR